jgi:hypothetical protein
VEAFPLEDLAMQPLSHVRPDAHVLFGHDNTMTSHPGAAVGVAECIAQWSNVEGMLGILLSFLLHAKAKTAMRMYMALENRAAQLRMLESAGDSELSELSENHRDLFHVLMNKYVRPLMRTRDKLAHWSWGYSPDLPDDLLLMESDVSLLYHHEALHIRGPIVLDPDKIFVVTKPYLSRVLRDLKQIESYLALFISSLNIEGSAIIPSSSALDTLSTRPDVARHLADRRKKAEIQRAQRLQSPETGDDEKSA